MALRIMLIATLLGVLTSCGVSDTSSPLASDSTPIPLAPASIIPAEPTPVAAPTADIDCSNLLALTSEEDQGECIRRKDAQPEQTLAVMQATLDVLNLTPQPTPTIPSEQARMDAGTPVPFDYIPPEAMQIRYIGEINDISSFRYARTIWLAGAVAPTSSDHYVSRIMVLATGSNERQFIARSIYNVSFTDDPVNVKRYTKDWECPRNVGELRIDSVTGPDGIITFSSTSGQRGTFDMATETWQFAE